MSQKNNDAAKETYLARLPVGPADFQGILGAFPDAKEVPYSSAEIENRAGKECADRLAG
jgi:hypothetical protein